MRRRPRNTSPSRAAKEWRARAAGGRARAAARAADRAPARRARRRGRRCPPGEGGCSLRSRPARRPDGVRDQPLVRPVVGGGHGVVGPLGAGCPGRPPEEGRGAQRRRPGSVCAPRGIAYCARPFENTSAEWRSAAANARDEGSPKTLHQDLRGTALGWPRPRPGARAPRRTSSGSARRPSLELAARQSLKQTASMLLPSGSRTNAA
jgi:hypothetical protein